MLGRKKKNNKRQPSSKSIVPYICPKCGVSLLKYGEEGRLDHINGCAPPGGGRRR